MTGDKILLLYLYILDLFNVGKGEDAILRVFVEKTFHNICFNTCIKCIFNHLTAPFIPQTNCLVIPTLFWVNLPGGA